MALLISTCSLFAQRSDSEQAVWKQEHTYWKDVQSGDMTGYLSLWNRHFVGWPDSSPKPAHKDQIANWIAAYKAKGLRLKSYELKPADSNATGNVVVTYYWIATDWTGKDGHEEKGRYRITHTWMRFGNRWQIIGGMSSPEPAAAQ